MRIFEFEFTENGENSLIALKDLSVQVQQFMDIRKEVKLFRSSTPFILSAVNAVIKKTTR